MTPDQTQNEYQQIQISMEEAQHAIDLQEALNRLHTHADFERIILRGYFEAQALNLVGMLGTHQMQAEDKQRALITDMKAISGLREYFRLINVQGNRARQAIHDSQQELQTMDNEAAESAAELN